MKCHRCQKTTIKLTLIRRVFFLLLLTHTPVSLDLSAAQCHPCYKLPEHFHHTRPYLRLGLYGLSLWISWLPLTAHSIDLQFVKALRIFWSLGQKHWKAEDCQLLHKNPKNQLQDKAIGTITRIQMRESKLPVYKVEPSAVEARDNIFLLWPWKKRQV